MKFIMDIYERFFKVSQKLYFTKFVCSKNCFIVVILKLFTIHIVLKFIYSNHFIYNLDMYTWYFAFKYVCAPLEAFFFNNKIFIFKSAFVDKF